MKHHLKELLAAGLAALTLAGCTGGTPEELTAFP